MAALAEALRKALHKFRMGFQLHLTLCERILIVVPI